LVDELLGVSTMSVGKSSDKLVSPDVALNKLLVGNERYVAGRTESQNPPSARAALAEGQSPLAVVIRCADSRVAPEIVFDQPLGALFVCGVAGNIPTPEIIASVEYAVAVLGCQAVIIMGHSSCGAVTAAMENQGNLSALPGSLPGLVGQIMIPDECVAESDEHSELDVAIAANAKAGIDRLMCGSQLIADAVGAGSLKIYAGVQNLRSGRFTLVS